MRPWRPQPMIVDMLCICGARYERTEKVLTACNHDSRVCEVCGAGLAAWQSSRIPIYRRKTRPRGENPSRP